MKKLLAALLLYCALLTTGLVAGWLAGTPAASAAITFWATPVLLLVVPRCSRVRGRRFLVWLDGFLTAVEDTLWKACKWLWTLIVYAVKHGGGCC